MRRTARLLVVAGIVVSIVVPATAAQAAGPKFTPLTLQNGWTGGPFGTAQPAVALVSGVVTFKGAVSGGASELIAILPAADTPSTDVYLHTGLCDAADGRVHITASGVVEVQPAVAFSSAQCFTSLDGLSFTLAEKGAKPLVLQDGWTNAPFGTSNAAVRTIAGVVRLQGAVQGGTDGLIATLPTAYRPKADVRVGVDLCDAAHGSVDVYVNGQVIVNASTDFGDAACFTSLDGVSWLKADSKANAKALTLENDWHSEWTTRPAGVHASGKVVRFAGGVFDGTATVIGTIPAKDAPTTNVYIPAVTDCGPAGENARLIVHATTGVVSVEPASESLGSAQCETTFDGSWFAQ